MSIPDELFKRATQLGFTKEAACALLANIQAESAFNPMNLEDSKEHRLGMSDQQYTDAVDSGRYQNFASDACGYGLAQWTYGPRKRSLLQYAIERNDSIGSFDMQKEFLFYEMQTSFSAVWKDLKQSHDLEYLVHELLYKWENPQEKENNMKLRLAYAQGWYQKYAVWESGGEHMTKEEAINKVLSLARSEIGNHEQGNNWTKYAQDMDRTNWYNGAKNGYPWCDVWYDWLFYKCFGDPLGREMICQPTGSAGAGCLYSAQYYKQAGQWGMTPHPGDQIFFTYSPGEYSHTGIVETVGNGVVVTIEGNTSDQVARRQYSIGSSTIAGYGTPRWQLATNAQSGSQSGGSVTPTPVPSPAVTMLRKGDRGEAVKQMQEKLLKLGYSLGPDGADGDFGGNTELAVHKFQVRYNLEADGIAGPETLKKLDELTKNASQTPPSQVIPVQDPEDVPPPIGVTLIKIGAKGIQVKLAQACLSCLGTSVSIDGIFGNEFYEKVKKFQKANGLEADGEVGEQTWKKLLDIPCRR